ncbi:hypothetical protein F2P56_033718 [Juglans regia]|nr:hypothetical protein F2P56_033718 [Juglans regia]
MAFTSNIQTTPSSSDHSSCSEHRRTYEVFLSFRGETRNTFTSHLCNALRNKFIYTFKDDERLEIGTPIKKELLDAIEKSAMAVIIISKEYASSTWCLEELVKILECKKEREMKVLPIFYHVEPSDVQHQEGTFGDAFAKHEQNLVNEDKVQTWKNALREVSTHVGRYLKNDEDEPKCIESIVKWISGKLIEPFRDDPDLNLVGIDSRLEEMNKHLALASNDVRFIGICGMSGMGKTTLADVIFKKFKRQFQAASFLKDVSSRSKENGLVALQERLLSDVNLKDDQEKWDELKGIEVIRRRLCYTKVLIVLDDVDDREQLEKLIGNSNWFGAGSRIIVTTEDTHLLTRHGVQIIYPIKGLDKKEALQLFCLKAFRYPDQCPDQEFLALCNDFVSYADGHPSTLDDWGSSLLGKGKEVWKSLLDKLKEFPHGGTQEKLKIAYDKLGKTEQKMFLDIACFFNGEDKHRVVDLLEGTSDCFPHVDIETLADKSFITIMETKLWMHSVQQRMGWYIVRCEHRDKPGKRSRLWRRDDIFEVLRKNSGTSRVQGIMLSTSSTHQEEDLNPEAFSKMDNLRLIKICDVNLPQGLNSLSNCLRLMEWHQYSLGSIPESFQPSNLVELIMHRSNFRQLPMAFLKLKKLKVMDFSGSENLMMIPDLSGCPSLQKLIFEGCPRLDKVPPSIGALKHLILLNLKDCKCLRSLPREINLESLNLLILSGCSSFNKFPEIGQNLSELYLDGTAIEELPLSIQHLTGLTLINLGECKKLSVFPSDICRLPALKTLILSGLTTTWSLLNFFSGLTSLVTLDLSDCNLLDGALPDNLSSLSSLEDLNLSRNNFTCLPDSISQLPKLKYLWLYNCSRLQSLPNLPSTTQVVITQEWTSPQGHSNQVVGSTSAGGLISDYVLEEASPVGSVRKRKMKEAFGTA